MSHPRRGLRAAVVAAAALPLAFLAACGSSTNAAASDDSAATSGSGGSSLAQAKADLATWEGSLDTATIAKGYAPLKSKPDVKGKKIMVVPLFTGAASLAGYTHGVVTALTTAGADPVVCNDVPAPSPTAIHGCLERAVSEKLAGVITMNIDYSLDPAGFDDLIAAKIPTLLFGENPAPDKPTTKTFGALIDKTNVMSQTGLAEAAYAIGDGKGSVLWTRLADTPSTKAAIQTGIDKYKSLCSSCALNSIDFESANLNRLPSEVSAALLKAPNTNIVIVPVDSFVAPVLQGIQAANMTGKVKVLSGSGDNTGVQRVQSGQQYLSLVPSVTYTGWRIVQAYFEMTQNGSITPDATWKYRAITPENASGLKTDTAAYDGSTWFGGDFYTAAFKKNWGVS